MKLIITGVLLAAGVFTACGTGNSSSVSTDSTNYGDIDPKARDGNTCLLAYAEKYGELLTRDMAAEVTGFPEDRAIVENINRGWESKEHDQVKYAWDNGREKLVKQINMKTRTRDFVQLTGIKAISLFEFQMSYRAVTDKDMESIQAASDDAIEGNTGSDAVNNARKKLDTLGIPRRQQKEIVKNVGSAAQQATKGYTPVDNVGDAAVWNGLENTLYVFTNGVKFVIVAEVGEDVARNRDVALAAAKRVLERCN